MRSAPLLVACIISLALTSVAAAQPAAARAISSISARAAAASWATPSLSTDAWTSAAACCSRTTPACIPTTPTRNPRFCRWRWCRGYVTFKREDPKKPTLVIYRRKLNAAQYAHLQLTIARLKTRERLWHMWLYNCNDFAGQVAREMGMVAPLPWVMPSAFVNGLRALNGP